MEEKEILKNICDDIFEITGIKTVFYDANMNIIYARDDTMSSFCRCVRKSDILCARCIKSDRDSFEKCKKTGDIEIYHCHMGLIEVVAPITEDGNVIGYIQFGQIADKTNSAIEKVSENAYIDKEEAFAELKKIPVTDYSVIRASARVVSMCASYVRLHEILRSGNERLAPRIDEFINKNLSNRIQTNDICKKFGISRTTLYNLSKERFGTGISRYISNKRIEKALELIKNGMNIYRVAEEVGIYDSNYLIKLVKKRTGMTPKQMQRYCK